MNGDEVSDLFTTKIGVKKGAVLKLFNIYVNDIIREVEINEVGVKVYYY